ncbi:myosin kinase [Mastigocoleus sp. MO_188.B34]|uniref:nSTAND1 domain-containing NTPase n=1 Tax=Mastigocoleus sp. MO_188.B34 TaxID=3036635 RepID=UPI002620A388|nr:myosin kinase [Mastigocoleus sp. MO_188.B34]MDJ0695610.1 myosin kinase [Mastigocoleus sp. MO_188.B34]
MQNLVSLKFGDGNFDEGFSKNSNIFTVVKINCESITRKIQLPPAPEIPVLYQKWKNSYASLVNPVRMGFKPKQTTNFSWFDEYQECDQLADDLRFQLNDWLANIKLQLQSLIELNFDSETILNINTQDIKSQFTKDILHRLPWREWDYFPGNFSVEVALCLNESEHKIATEKHEEVFRRVRITSIFGDGRNIDIDTDKKLIEKLKPRGAELILLSQPKRPELIQLWDEPCDILFYSGHSQTDRKNRVASIEINERENLSIREIRNTFREAIAPTAAPNAKGLKLAIFNSCDGLGLAEQLSDLKLPYIIVWREAVPDKIAQYFLQYFLVSFAQGKSLFASMRDARVKLQELKNIEDTENQVPGVNWLPIICRNTIESPPTWEDLGGLTGKLPDSPYKGLSTFREEDAGLFFGRDRFIADLVKAVLSKPLVPVVGASGSGKSSVVFAGLVPQLRNNHRVKIISFRPGKNPFDALAVALSAHYQSQYPEHIQREDNTTGNSYRLKELKLEINLNDDEKELCQILENIANSATFSPLERLVLIVDQFEEIYTLATQEQRQKFLDTLIYAIKFTSDFTLVFTLRADFMGKLLDYQPMGETLQMYPPMLLTPMKPSELQEAIEKPAGKMKVELEQGLTSKLIGDLGKQPGRLPLLEFTLTQLWQKPNKWYLTHRAYGDIGGLDKALAKYADSVLQSLSVGEKQQAERIFIQLLRPGEGTEDTKRMATRIEVGDNNWNLVKSLADRRLVVTGWDKKNQIETVEIIHEALIREWGTLRKWIENNREFRIWQERLKPDVRQWENKKYDPENLLQGTRLGIAQDWLKQRPEELTLVEQDFIIASVGQKNKERRKHQRRRNLTISGLVIGLVFVSTFAGISELRRTDAEVGKISSIAERLFSQNNHEAALTEAIKAAKLLQKNILRPWIAPETRMQVISTLNQTVYGYQIKTLKGHLRDIISVNFSPDGSLVASGSGDFTIKLWNPNTGEEIKTLSGHKSAVIDVAFSPDGKTLASGSADRTLQLWNLDTGEVIETFTGHSSRVISVAFSPDGKIIASGSGDGTVKLWNVDTGKEIRTLIGHSHEIYSVDFSSDGQKLVSGSSDSTIKIWDVTTGEEIKTLEGHSRGVIDANFSPNDKLIVSGSSDHTIKVWEVDTGKVLQTLKQHTGGINSVSFSPDGKTIASGSNDYTLQIWDTRTWERVRTFKGHSNRVRSISFSPDGKTIASGSIDGTIKIWNTSDNNIIKKRKNFEKHKYAVMGASFSPAKIPTPQGLIQTIASGSRAGILKIWNRNTGEEIYTLKGHSGEIRSFSLSPIEVETSQGSGKIVAYGTENGVIKIWEMDTGKEVRTLKAHDNPIKDLRFSPNARIIASISEENIVKIWDVNTGKQIQTLRGHSGKVTSISFSPNGEVIASGSADKTIKLWELNTGKEIKTLTGNSHQIDSVSFSQNGKIIASGSQNGIMQLWDPNTGRNITTIKRHSHPVTSLIFSPDSKIIASASTDDDKIMIWNVNTGENIQTLEGHYRSVTTLSFSPDSKIIVSGSKDKTVKLWDISAGKELRTLRGHHQRITSVNFSSDGKNVISASLEGTVKLRDFESGGRKENIKLHSNSINEIDYSNDGEIIASASCDRTVRLWDSSTGKEIRRLKHASGVSTVNFSPNGKMIASGTDNGMVTIWNTDGTVKIWNLLIPEQIKKDKSQSTRVNTLKFSPDSKTIAFSSNENNVRIWDIENRKEIHILKGHSGEVRSVSFSPNGKILASGAVDNTIKLWDTHTGKELKTLRGHSDKVISVNFSPDGNIITSGSSDRKLRLWDAKTGREIKALKGDDSWVRSVSFSPDGKTVVSTSTHGRVILWNFDLVDLIDEGCHLIRGYLRNNPDVNENERYLCNEINF